MKIALLGYGKMGQLIACLAQQKGHEVTAAVSSRNGGLDAHLENLAGADVWIDFSHADQVLKHLRHSIELKKPLVIGTTGWEKEMEQAQSLLIHSPIGCLYAPNFSIGVHLFKQIVAYAAQLIGPFQDYDISGIEYHHREKRDAPSGTAKALTHEIIRQLPHLEGFQFTSVRCGSIPGTHSLCLDSPADTITLTHQARNRDGFAAGAIAAAEWLIDKKGFFTLDDLLASAQAKSF